MNFATLFFKIIHTLDSGIDVGKEINVGQGKFGINNKHRTWIYYLHITQKSTSPMSNKAVGPGKKNQK